MSNDVALLPPAALEEFPPVELEVRQRRLASATGGSIAVLIAIAAAVAPYLLSGERSRVAVIMGCWVALFSSLYGWFLLRHARKAGGPLGWVLRANGDYLFINLRSHLNTHFDLSTPSVLVLPHCRVLSLRVVYEDGVRTHVGDHGVLYRNRIRRQFLDISFDGDTAALTSALAAEGTRRGKTTLGSSRYNHSALKMLSTGELRIAWRDEANRLRPDLETVRSQLCRKYPFADAVSGRQAPLDSLTAAERDALLLDMATRGERVEAVKLAKTLYGLSTTEAVRHIDGLEGRKP